MKMIALSVVLALAIAAPAAQATETELTGTWTLVYADVIRPDGSLGHDYGASPSGLLMIDDHGNYSQQIYDAARPKFAAGDKAKATADEYRAAIVGASIHFGAITVEPAKHSFTQNLVSSTYPNQEGASQGRTYTLKDGVMITRGVPRPNGDVTVTAWKRVK